MVRFFFCLLLLFAVVGQGLSQSGFKPPATGVGVIYNTETTINMKLVTHRSFAIGMEFGRLQTYDKTKYYHVSIGEIKHPKEYRQSADPSVSRSFRPYVFGKQNNLLVIRAGWGMKHYFSEKAKQKGVAIGMSYSFGPSLGLLKPYYLALRYTADGAGNSRILHQKYSEENAAVFLDNTRILGASPFTRGLGKFGFRPGANATVALHLDWGAFDDFVKALELGLMIDAFAQKVPILVSSQNDRLFFNFFLNLQLGKRK